MGFFSEEQLRHYDEQGYILLRQAFSPQRIGSLRAAVEERGGRCELSPEAYHPAVGEWLAEELTPMLDGLMLRSGAPARHSLFGMLSSGRGEDVRQKWHRDPIAGKEHEAKVAAGTPGELPYLRALHGQGVQFNAPLLPNDSCLHIVPGSHLRASTPEQIEATKRPNGEDPSLLPGGLVVAMQPGDICLYNFLLYHRGWNPAGPETVPRWTVHCAYWDARWPVMRHERGQHDSLLAAGHLERMPPAARQLCELRRCVAMRGRRRP